MRRYILLFQDVSGNNYYSKFQASGMSGFAPNLGDTQDGIEAVLKGWSKVGNFA